MQSVWLIILRSGNTRIKWLEMILRIKAQKKFIDVYKRQALEDADVMDGYIPTSDDKERRREWEDTIKETLMAVSYTHLEFNINSARTRWYIKLTFIVSSAMLIVSLMGLPRSMSVSYTHLDVYKRQV